MEKMFRFTHSYFSILLYNNTITEEIASTLENHRELHYGYAVVC